MKFNKNTTIEAVLKRRLMPRPNLANVKKGDKYPVDGLSKRKEALLAASGDLLDLAVAMQEIETMRASPHKDYPYGDCKDGDAANFGIFRQNWWMIRKCGALKPRPPKREYGPQDYREGERLNRNLYEDVGVLHTSMAYFGVGPGDGKRLAFGWWMGHRGGEGVWSGKQQQNDVPDYMHAVLWIYCQLRDHPETQTDDTRWPVYVKGLGSRYESKPAVPVPDWCKKEPYHPLGPGQEGTFWEDERG